MKTRRGVAIVRTAPGQSAVTLAVERPPTRSYSTLGEVDWHAHFAWLATRPKVKTNPVDELRAQEHR